MIQASEIRQAITQFKTALVDSLPERLQPSYQPNDILLRNSPSRSSRRHSVSNSGPIVLQRAGSNASQASRTSHDSEVTLVPPGLSSRFEAALNNAVGAQQNNPHTSIVLRSAQDGAVASIVSFIISFVGILFSQGPGILLVLAPVIAVSVGAIMFSVSLVVQERNLMAQNQEAAAQANFTGV